MECPESHPIKGNISGDRMIYHLPEQEFYEQTRPEVCFASAGEAAQAGFRPSRR
jgi:micrococcal nuclease